MYVKPYKNSPFSKKRKRPDRVLLRLLTLLLPSLVVVVILWQHQESPPAALPPPAIMIPTETPMPITSPSISTPTPLPHADLIAALQQGNIETAIQIIQAIHDPKPEDVKLLSMGVRIMLDHLYVVDATDFKMPSIQQKMDAALHVADLAIQADPNVPDGWNMKALALNWAFRSDEALALILTVRTHFPRNPAAMIVQAEIYTDLKRYSEAQTLLDQAFAALQSTTPPNKTALARAYYIRGNIAQILGLTDDAIQAYESAWQISALPYDPADPWAVVPPGYILYQLGPIYLFQNKAQLALERYTAALSVDKQDPFLYYLRGRVYRYLGDPSRAVAEFQNCLDMDRQQWRCLRNLGQMAYEHSDWDKVVASMQPIISENSQISDDYYYLAAAYQQLGQCNQTLPLAEQGMALLVSATGQPYWNNLNFQKVLKTCHSG